MGEHSYILNRYQRSSLRHAKWKPASAISYEDQEIMFDVIYVPALAFEMFTAMRRKKPQKFAAMSGCVEVGIFFYKIESRYLGKIGVNARHL